MSGAPPGKTPKFGPTKTGNTRVVTLTGETMTQLRAHKQAQAALKLKNRTTYADHRLVFAKEFEDLQTPTAALGQPLRTLSEKRFQRLVGSAEVRRIRFHGVRHTAATLLLGAGVPVQVVSQRLGHANPTVTMNVYAHVMPNSQKDAAMRLGAALAGR